ncbi:hypothetical protein GQ54DRAFT_298859 [Martensiomyces pterosporus]|nr:hypothetical protein GQ54DRAFT_298859 [Martensiomyces pterosporus]
MVADRLRNVAKRAKSPATRNKFNDIGVTGRKTGVRVAGSVGVDADGLENIEEFYKKTSPVQEKADDASKAGPSTQTLHQIVSPTPVRSSNAYDTLIGALEMPAEADSATSPTRLSAEGVDEATVTPTLVRTIRAQSSTGSRTAEGPKKVPPPNALLVRPGNRRNTIAPSRQAPNEPRWVRSPQAGRRATMAFSTRAPRQSGEAQVSNASSKEGSAETEEQTEEQAEEAVESAGEKHVSDSEAESAANLPEPPSSPELGNSLNGHAMTSLNRARPSVDDRDDSESVAEEDEGPANVIEEAEPEEYEEEEENGVESASEAEAEAEAEANATPEIEEEEEEEEEAEPDSAAAPETDEEIESGDEVASPSKTATPSRRGGRKRKEPRARSKRSGQLEPEQPIRRSTRASVQPLAFWRNEHIEYEYEAGGGTVVPKVKNIVRVRQTAEERKIVKRRRVKLNANSLPTLKRIAVSELDPNDRGRFFYYDDENYGFPVEDDRKCRYGPKFNDKNASPNPAKHSKDQFEDDDDIPMDEAPRAILSPDGETETSQEVVISRSSIEWQNFDTKKDKYRVGLGLYAGNHEDEIFSSSGILSLAVGGRKPTRTVNNRALFYLVTSGRVEVTLHNSAFQVGILGQFVIPSGNVYSISNTGTHPAQLYYVQVTLPEPAAGRTENDDEDGDEPLSE